MGQEALPRLDLSRLNEEERQAVQKFGEIMLWLETADSLSRNNYLSYHPDRDTKRIVDQLVTRELPQVTNRIIGSAEELRFILGLD